VRRGLWLFWLLFLAACTGTYEPETPVVLVGAAGNELRFFDAGALNHGEAAAPIGSWDLGEAVLDLGYAEGRLFVLTETRLLRFASGGVTLTAMPDVAAAKTGEWTLSCGGSGYLRLGAREVLAVCGDKAWRLSQVATSGAALTPVDLGPYPGWLALALVYDKADASDRLLVLEGAASGATLRWKDTEVALSQPGDVAGGWLFWDPVTGRVAAGLEDGFEDHDTLYQWTPGEAAAAVLGQADLGPKGLFGAFGDWVFFGDRGALWSAGSPKTTHKLDATGVAAAWLHPDLYLYLAEGSRLSVFDAAASPPERLFTRYGLGFRALSGFPLR